MKRILLGVLAGAILIGTGCDEKARDFALKTKDILDQRSQQLSRKIAAEKAAYNRSATLAAEDHRMLTDSALLNERNERSDEIAADYDEGRKPTSLWRKDISDYARLDNARNRELLTADMDANTRYLDRFETLKIEQDKVDALSKLLASLAAKPSIKDDLARLSGFAEDTKQEFDVKVCKQLKVEKTATDDAGKAATKSYADKKCDDVLKPSK